jgi:hypothetical protein
MNLCKDRAIIYTLFLNNLSYNSNKTWPNETIRFHFKWKSLLCTVLSNHLVMKFIKCLFIHSTQFLSTYNEQGTVLRSKSTHESFPQRPYQGERQGREEMLMIQRDKQLRNHMQGAQRFGDGRLGRWVIS